MLGAGLDEGTHQLWFCFVDPHGAFDLARIPTDLVAPPVDDVVLGANHGGVSVPVPHVRVLGHQAKGAPLAVASDQDRQSADWSRLQQAEAPADSW